MSAHLDKLRCTLSEKNCGEGGASINLGSIIGRRGAGATIGPGEGDAQPIKFAASTSGSSLPTQNLLAVDIRLLPYLQFHSTLNLDDPLPLALDRSEPGKALLVPIDQHCGSATLEPPEVTRSERDDAGQRRDDDQLDDRHSCLSDSRRITSPASFLPPAKTHRESSLHAPT